MKTLWDFFLGIVFGAAIGAYIGISWWEAFHTNDRKRRR